MKIGDYFQEVGGDVYILAQVERKKVALIGLTSGNRWKESKEVEDVRDISDDEWHTIHSLVGTSFKKINIDMVINELKQGVAK